jgi:hypothetical protein
MASIQQSSLPGSAALPFVISTGAHPDFLPRSLDKTARAPFFKERRIQFASATNFYRKSGGAERRDLCVDASSWKCFSRSVLGFPASPLSHIWLTEAATLDRKSGEAEGAVFHHHRSASETS